MTKHQIVHDLVMRLTSDAAFRTFFTLYLMAETATERKRIEEVFWAEVEQLSERQQQLFQAEFTRTFLQIPVLLEQMRQRVKGRCLAA